MPEQIYAKPVTTDDNLTWKKQIDVCKLCARNIGVFNKVLKHFLSEQALYKFILFINITIFKLRLASMGECKQNVFEKSV